MQVRDVMTAPVVTTVPEASLADAARVFVAAGVSGGPVVDAAGRVVGMITEADFLEKSVEGSNGTRKRRLFADRGPGRSPADAATVGEAMTTQVVTIHASASLTEAGRRMVRSRVRRLPVVDADGTLVGIVSRSDILKVFARPDADITAELTDLLQGDLLASAGSGISVAVDDGVVTLAGKADTRADRSLIEHVIASGDGVVRVNSDLDLDVDEDRADTKWAPYAQEGAEH